MTLCGAGLALLLVLAGTSGSALAKRGGGGHRGHSHHHSRVGVFIAAPLLFPWGVYPPADYRYPPEPTGPTAYIEKGDEASRAAQAPAYWYYCPESRSYYPDVQTCASGWQQLVSQPPPAN